MGRGGAMDIMGDIGGRSCRGRCACEWAGDLRAGPWVARCGENLFASLRSIEDPRTPRALLTSEI